jgi:hypothetical protein
MYPVQRNITILYKFVRFVQHTFSSFSIFEKASCGSPSTVRNSSRYKTDTSERFSSDLWSRLPVIAVGKLMFRESHVSSRYVK